MRSDGFTLIEILVAMAIMAVIGVGALSILNTATTTSNKIKVDGKRLNDVQRAFLLISQDMQQLTSRLVRDEFGDRLPAMKSDLQSSAPYLRVTRLGRRNPALLPRSNLEHLIYTIEGKQLYRISYPYVDGMVAENALKRPLLENVEAMKVQFYDGEEWYDYWPIDEGSEDANPQALPVGVKFELELTDYGKLERVFALSDRIEKSDRG
nr:type II secretion system minor pseudopilin GspJ [Aliikangiella sp. G2MR2-5]